MLAPILDIDPIKVHVFNRPASVGDVPWKGAVVIYTCL